MLGDSASCHLVCLHGWGRTRDSLRAIGALFVPTHSVHLVDLPGFGDAPPPPADWDTARYADLVEAWIAERLHGPVVLLGHSFGGRVALRLAARKLAAIRGLILMGVPGLPAPLWSARRLRRAAVRWLRRLARLAKPVLGERLLDWHTRRFGSADYLAAGAMRSVLVQVVSEDLTDSARAVVCPTLLLWGEDDTDAPVWMAQRYEHLMNGRATLEVLPHKDHHLQAGTGAHLCAFKIRAWLPAHVSG